MTHDLLHWVHITPEARLNFTLSLEFKAADLWIGAYWTRKPNFPMTRWVRFDLWVCLLPTLPIHLVLYRRMPRIVMPTVKQPALAHDVEG